MATISHSYKHPMLYDWELIAMTTFASYGKEPFRPILVSPFLGYSPGHVNLSGSLETIILFLYKLSISNYQ